MNYLNKKPPNNDTQFVNTYVLRKDNFNLNDHDTFSF